MSTKKYRYTDIVPKIVNYIPKDLNGLLEKHLVNVYLDAFSEPDRFAGYDIVGDELAIRNSLLNIFVIQKGEVPGKPKFGNPLNIKVFDIFDFFNASLMRSQVINIVKKYEPRVTVNDVKINELPEYNRIIIQLEYQYVIDNSVRYDTLAIPYAHNNISFLGGRQSPPDFTPGGGCITRNIRNSPI